MVIQGPNLIFQVASAKQSIREDKWRAAAHGYSTFYAYHGSRLENFHSIMHYGIQKNMCKVTVFQSASHAMLTLIFCLAS